MVSLPSIVLFRGMRLGRPTSPRSTTLQCPSLVFAKATPDSRILISVERILQAVFGDGAMRTDRFRSIDLLHGRTGIAYWKKKLRVYRQTRCSVTPIQLTSPHLHRAHCAQNTKEIEIGRHHLSGTTTMTDRPPSVPQISVVNQGFPRNLLPNGRGVAFLQIRRGTCPSIDHRSTCPTRLSARRAGSMRSCVFLVNPGWQMICSDVPS